MSLTLSRHTRNFEINWSRSSAGSNSKARIVLLFEAFVSRDLNRWPHRRRGLPICARTRMTCFWPKLNFRSVLTISSLDSRIRFHASTYNASKRSAHWSGSKLCASRKQAKHHGFRIPRPLPPLTALHTTRAVPLRHSRNVINRTLWTQEFAIEKTSCHRARVTHEVINQQTRIRVNSSRNCHHETIRVHLTVTAFTTSRHIPAQLKRWPLRNRFSRIPQARNRIRQSVLRVAILTTSRRRVPRKKNRRTDAPRVVASCISVKTACCAVNKSQYSRQNRSRSRVTPCRSFVLVRHSFSRK